MKTIHSTKSNIVWLALEVVIVFIGVYAAFSLENLQNEKKLSNRRNQIYEALYNDFKDSSEKLSKIVPVISSQIEKFLLDYNNGEMPNIGDLRFNVSFGTRVWETILQIGGLELLEPKLILEIDDLYIQIQRLDDISKETSELSSMHILPFIDNGNDFFYNKKSKKLKKRFSWYIKSITGFRNQITEIEKMSSEIYKKLEKDYKKN